MKDKNEETQQDDFKEGLKLKKDQVTIHSALVSKERGKKNANVGAF